MIINLKANLKLNNGQIMRKGRYDDIGKPFPQEIYEEIKLESTRNRGTIEVLSDEPNPTAEFNLMDPGIVDTSTSEEKPDLGKEEVPDKILEETPKKKDTKTRVRKPRKKQTKK